MRTQYVYLATPGVDRDRLGAVWFTGAPFVRAAMRTAYRMARRSCDPIEARIVVVTAFAGGLGGDPLRQSSTAHRFSWPTPPVMRLVGGGGE